MNSDRPRIAVAINPAASFGAHAHVGRALAASLSDLGCVVDMLIEADAATLRRSVDTALQSAPDALVVVGGDGIVNLAVNALAGVAVPLAILPTGTGNDFARGLGIRRRDPDAAARDLVAALGREPLRVDVGVVTAGGRSHRFVGVVSAGFDANVNERANTWTWPRGRARYVLALLRELVGLRPRSYRVRIDGREIDREAVIVSVANNRYMGGGMAIAPHASLHDGKLDVVIVAPLTRRRLLRLFPRVFAGAHIGLDVVSVERGRNVEIDAPDTVAYADGERIGALPMSVAVDPGSLAILA